MATIKEALQNHPRRGEEGPEWLVMIGATLALVGLTSALIAP